MSPQKAALLRELEIGMSGDSVPTAASTSPKTNTTVGTPPESKGTRSPTTSAAKPGKNQMKKQLRAAANDEMRDTLRKKMQEAYAQELARQTQLSKEEKEREIAAREEKRREKRKQRKHKQRQKKRDFPIN